MVGQGLLLEELLVVVAHRLAQERQVGACRHLLSSNASSVTAAVVAASESERTSEGSCKGWRASVDSCWTTELAVAQLLKTNIDNNLCPKLQTKMNIAKKKSTCGAVAKVFPR